MPMMNVVNSNNFKHKRNVLDYYSNNPFFVNKEGYDNFIACMIKAAEENNLPIVLEQQYPERVTMYDIKEFSKRFKKDTGLYIDFRLTTCNNCDKLHINMVVDEYSEETNGENIVYL